MADQNEKVKTGLNEGRILILGAQVLLGFQYWATFEPGFQTLPRLAQYLTVGGLLLMLVAIALLLWPAAYHRIVERGEVTARFHRFATRAIGWALLPFASGLGVNLGIVGDKVHGLALRQGLIAIPRNGVVNCGRRNADAFCADHPLSSALVYCLTGPGTATGCPAT